MDSDSQFWWNWGVQFGIAAGTIGAVVLALFGDWIRSRLAPARLSLAYENASKGVKTPVTLTSPDGSVRTEEGRYYYLRVHNARRWVPVTGVQVFLLRLEERDPAGRMQPAWIGEVPMRWRDQEVHPLARTIGAPAECDLCAVIKGKWIELQTLIAPLALERQRRGACHIVLTLQARGVETDSNLLRIEIAWDGLWADDSEDMARHLVVTAVSAI